eukprot:TRINITY_DN16764_c0_g1_i1.p2 TRINITY_DN16764_c0_g1~~TRINITY_DN16764_c0_g1_i1.p2  ORF type:complete len:142 (-),score=45.04 TRINITY_DN16764_c0_g1_i1:191-616(-)
MISCLIDVGLFFFFSSRRRHTRCREVSWARRCVQETGYQRRVHGDTAFVTIVKASENEIKKKTKKFAQRVINKMVEGFSIYSFILRDTLQFMLETWKQKKFGKMYRKSLPLYKNFCEQYLKRVNALICIEKSHRRPVSSQQ